MLGSSKYKSLDMYAECPHCHAIFRVTEDILARAGGKVRCGECNYVFEVVEVTEDGSAIDNPPTDETLVSGDVPAHEADSDKPVVSVPQIEPAKPEKPLPNGLPSSFSPEDEAPVEGDDEKDEPEEDFELIIEEREEIEENPRQSASALRYLGIGAALGLILLLLAQIMIANRNTIVNAVPALHPVLSGLCSVAGCTVDPRRDVKKIELVRHSIFSHPGSEGALMIRGAMVNNAVFEQPYPVIQLKLSNIQGKPVSMRRFGPDEYLDTSAPLPPLMPQGEPINIQLEVVDPGKNALAFEFDFL